MWAVHGLQPYCSPGLVRCVTAAAAGIRARLQRPVTRPQFGAMSQTARPIGCDAGQRRRAGGWFGGPTRIRTWNQRIR